MSFMISKPDSQPLSAWVKISAIYLYVPFILFIVGWLKPWISLPLLTCITASGFVMIFRSGPSTFTLPDKQQIRNAACAAGAALAFAILTGMIDWVPQSNDYLKHNLILGDLIERPWPVRYTTPDGARFLCYGLGYYMVPALIAKGLGSTTVGFAGFVWSLLGLFLFFHWLGRRFARLPLLGIGIFLLASGLGAFWHLVKSGFLLTLVKADAAALATPDRLLDLGLYTSNLDSFTRFLYQPQHGLVAWLGGALIYELVIIRRRWTESAAVLAATAFWSPLTALGLAVIGAAAMLANRGEFTTRPTIHLLSAFAVTSVLVAYYLPHVPIVEKGFIWTLGGDSSWMIWYLLFLLLFAFVPVSAIAWLEKKHGYLGSLKPVVVGMTLVLVLSPLFKLGQLGDLRMQISGPAFLFIALAMAKGLIESPPAGLSKAYVYLAAVFLAGAIFPLFRSLDNLAAAGKPDYSIATLRSNNLNSILDLTMPGFEVSAQYLGNSESTSAGLVLKSPAP